MYTHTHSHTHNTTQHNTHTCALPWKKKIRKKNSAALLSASLPPQLLTYMRILIDHDASFKAKQGYVYQA